jgi:iron complex outermembrane receptor protein
MKIYFLVAFVLIFIPLFAGTTGKLAGKITKEDGEPVAYANIFIEELQHGIQADENGKYILRNIAPGVYEVTCSQISYTKHIVKSVKIISDETTTLNIVLIRSTTEIEGLQVTEARVKMVDRLKTSSGNVISKATIEDVAVQDIEDLIAIQAGAIVAAYNRY